VTHLQDFGPSFVKNIVAGCDENRDKIKLSLRMIHMDDKDMRPVEQYGPSFIPRNEKGRLYKCQMFRACNNSTKENTWVRDYGIDLKEVRRAHFNSGATSYTESSSSRL
jgi:hypothetical protein